MKKKDECQCVKKLQLLRFTFNKSLTIVYKRRRFNLCEHIDVKDGIYRSHKRVPIRTDLNIHV